MPRPVPVLVTMLRSPEKRERLRAQLARELGDPAAVDLAFANGKDEILAALPGREVVFGTTVTPAMLAAAPELRWVQLISAGVEHVLKPEVLASPVMITNARGMHVTHMSEHVLAYLLAFARCLPECHRAQTRHEWSQDALKDRAWTLSGRTAGILGLGAIGQATAVRLAALGMRVIGMRRRNDGPLPPGVTRAVGPEGLDEVLEASEVLVITLPLTDSTRGLLKAPELARLPRGAYVVNVARGAIVDEPALIEALRTGALGGAGLDVFTTEPLPEDSPFWDLPNVIVTPHSSGNYAGYVEQATSIFAANLARWRRGEPLANLVDKTAGY